MKQPSFFIVGAPKSGTTSLYRYLNQHPEIFMSSPKELGFFSTEHEKGRHLTLKTYLQHFEEGKGKICGEGTTRYLRSPYAAENIYDFNPEAKIIIMLRDPVNLLYSYHKQIHFDGNAKSDDDFQVAMEQEQKRLQGKEMAFGDPDCYRNIVNFTQQIEKYYSLFDRQKVKIIIFDDLAEDTPGVYREVLEFLEVEPNFEADFKIKNPSKSVRSKFVRDLIKRPPSRVLEWGKFLLPLPREKRRGLLQTIKSKLYKMNKVRKSKPPLNLDFCLKLQKEFAPEVERLGTLIGRDLTFWNHEEYWRSPRKIGSAD